MRQLVRPEPPEWWNSYYAKVKVELREAIDQDPARATSAPRLFQMGGHRRFREIRDIFAACSSGYCHVCGASQAVSLDHYRPKSMAGNIRRERSHPKHYWWLIYEWRNFQLLCHSCNRYKMNLFPITGGRAREGAQGAELDLEGPLLLNAFEDNPREHFNLNNQGVLIPTSERGKTTIELYRLNGDFFIQYRNELINNYLREFEAVSKISGAELDYYSRVLEYSQLNRPQDEMVLDAVRRIITSEPAHSRKSKEERLRKEKASQEARSVPKKFEATWITSVRVRDFGAIKELDLNFPEFNSDLEPWLGIVGENGVGKSTFLKAIAIALVDSETAKDLIGDASRVLNRDTRNRTGYVEVKFSDGRSRRVKFRRNSEEFQFSGEEVRLPVIALGANRITGTSGTARTLRVSSAVNNLFDPILPLADAEDWLSNTSIVSAQDFSSFGQNLKDLMDLPLSTRVTRREGRIFFHHNGSRQSLGQMSDGFRAVIGLTTHIIKYLAADTPLMSEAEGTVLLDEIELHLHPLWKRRIVSKLRQIFPRVRFVITTHDPLCLRGLALDESYVFRRNPESDTIEAQALNILPGMDVDDLLTGGWFGLATTYDEETEDMIRDLSALSLQADQLRVLGANLSEGEQLRLEKLSKDLRERLPTSSGIDPAELLEVDAEALQARLKQAFDRTEK